MGRIGLNFDDFERLTPDEFSAVADSWYSEAEMKHRAEWERSRWLAACMLTPHSKKAVAPKDIVEFEWEKTQNASPVQRSTREAFEKAKELFEHIVAIHPDGAK